MTRAQRLIWSALLVGLCASGAFVCGRVAERGRFTGAYSSYGSGEKGTRALFLLAERLGARPERWAEDLAALPDGGAMLVALGDCETGLSRAVSRYERQELVQWIERGGVLLVAGARGYIPSELGLSFEPEPGCNGVIELLESGEEEGEGSDDDESGEHGSGEHGSSEDASSEDGEDPALTSAVIDSGTIVALEDPGPMDVVWTSPEAAPLLGLPPIAMRKPGRIVIDDVQEAKVLLTFPDAPDMPESPVQREAAVTVTRGRGRVVLLASGSMLQNGSLAASDGGALFARLLQAYAPAGQVLFDEYHLGVGEKRSMVRYLRRMGATPYALLVLFALLLWLWRAGARFGATRIDKEPAPAGTASFVASLGSLFARVDDPGGAVQVLSRQALATVAARHHLPLSSAFRLSRALAERGLTAAAAEVRTIGEAERILISEKHDLVEVSRKLDEAVARACAQPAAIKA